ncbi:hypothetical protein L3Y34_007275 [Caenorhabditis briggsae]|uniref:Uncharacterized protein n=1 Tax=Caenorhabditis briggsae TaxID=6238 RepID=A0AAE9A237_CAEBR|nr:hypothetical protein L3Y34_007275 [Caenorhabditis briggsae]
MALVAVEMVLERRDDGDGGEDLKKIQFVFNSKVALEPLLAAQNFNVFVPMMMRKNIELQLQALQMIEFMCGLIPSVLQLEDGESLKNKKMTPEQTERYVLISVLRHSKDEYEATQKGTEELEQVAKNSRIQREALERDIEREEALLQRALEMERMENQRNRSAQTDVPGTSSLRSVAAIMAATFSIDTATNTDDIKVQLLDEEAKKTTSSGTMTSSGVSSGTMASSSSGTMTTPSGVFSGDAGFDAAYEAAFGATNGKEKGKESRPKSAKRVGSAVGKRSGSAVKANQDSGFKSDPDNGEARPRTGSKVNAESNTEERRPRTASKKTTSTTVDSSEVQIDVIQETPIGTSPENTEKKRPTTGAKKSSTSEAQTDAIKKTSTGTSPENMEKEKKRPGTAKNERKYSTAGLEDLEGLKTGASDEKSEPRSRPSTRKSSRADERPPSRKAADGSHEPRAKTPLQKGFDERPVTRRSSVDKNAPKRNDSVPRERKHAIPQDDRKPPKPIGPLKSNKYDGEVVMGRPGSPGRDHGPRRKNLNDVNSHLVDINRLNSSDVRTRAQYLKEQRDKLLQMKNEERIKQMNDIQNSGLERPKTAARAREILDKDKRAAGEIRKEISKKLKTQILTLN